MFAQETGRNITGAAYRFGGPFPVPRRAEASAEGELTFLQEMASHALSRGPQAPRAAGGGAGGGSAGFRTSEASQATEEEGAGVGRVRLTIGVPKKGKSPAQVRYDQKHLLLYQKKANNKANKNAGKSNKG